uniref:NAD(P)H-quinone oxidoreductase subunit 3 n=1 Tax=Cyathodium smaragdinum TaxID=2846787 RepID=A0A8F3BDR7_9MARC|nr:NADH-plastoquinone oxidoreductase subunit 3 [Cyathodium smaragdinum]
MFLFQKYDYFFAFLSIISFFSITILFVSEWIAPANKGPEKLTSYESGIEPMGEACIQFQIRYYMFALVSVISDVETVFLYPCITIFYNLGISSFIESSISISILVIGLAYAWRKGALEWS